jgi:glycosyltransferase involved in cell wall biosynthesis
MRILYFAPHSSWPLTTGARLRDYHLARQLGARCSLTFAGLIAPGEEQPPDPPAGSNFESNITLTRGPAYTPVKILRGLLGPVPVTLLNYFHHSAADRLAKIIDEREIDTVQMESVHLLPYLPAIRATRRNPPVLADWHNIESELMYRFAAQARNPLRRWAANRTAYLIERSEERLLASCRFHTVASERERDALRRRSPGADIRVVFNGVDVDFYSEASPIALADAPALLFVGSMDYHANIDAVLWFVRKIWPELKRTHPRLVFFVVGRNPPSEIRELASDGITITGTVDDVRPWYRNATAAVVPLRTGSGTRLKILEAMAAGVPVISTTLGAEGLDVSHRSDILLADTRVDIVAAVNQVIASEPLQHQLRQAGRTLVTERYDWRALGTRLYEIHSEMLA